MMAQITRTPFLMLNASNDPITEALEVIDDTMEFAAVGTGGEFNNIYSEQTKSAGALVIGILSAIRGKSVFNQSGASASQMMGIEAECIIEDGSPLITSGIKCLIQATAGATPGFMDLLQGALVLNAGATVGNTRGLRSDLTIAGDVSGFVRGAQILVNINAGGTVSSHIYGVHIDVDNDGAVSGTAYGLRLDTKTAIDYAFYHSGTAPSRLGGQLSVGATAPSVNYELGAVNSGILCMKEGATPTADADHGKIYCKNDNKIYFQDGAGGEHELAFA